MSHHPPCPSFTLLPLISRICQALPCLRDFELALFSQVLAENVPSSESPFLTIREVALSHCTLFSSGRLSHTHLLVYLLAAFPGEYKLSKDREHVCLADLCL